MRLDKFLSEKIPAVSRSRIQKAIREGRVFVNDQPIVETDYHVKETDLVKLPEFESDEPRPSDTKLKVVFENDDLAVIDKQAGLVVHPGAGHTQDTLINALLTYFPQIKNVGEPHRPGIVHRLDEDTSGLIVIAKTNEAYEYLKKAFQDREVEKEYLALAHGKPENMHGIIDLPIAKAPTHRKMSAKGGSLPAGQAGASGGKTRNWKDAKTEYFVISQSPDDALDQYTLFRVKLHTGRTHQIRVHLNAIGHPLVGDETYGAYKKKDFEIIDRQFLHAHKLKFKLMDGSVLELISELPDDLRKVLEKLRINFKF